MLRPTLIGATILAASSTLSAQSTLLITEFAVTPTAGEMVEFFNPNAEPVDLSDYYVSDATFAGGPTYYYNLVNGAPGGGSFGDFSARFPAGATIAPGEYQTVAFADAEGALGFFDTYGVLPTYECIGDLGNDDAGVANMLEAVPGSINGGGGLTNSGEFCTIFYWDGSSDLVTDIDYVMWGDANEGVDKTGVSVDGPDGDAIASTYLNDTALGSQIFMSTHSFGDSNQRVMMSEGLETTLAGNAVNGNDETSENLDVTFEAAVWTPNARTVNAVDYSWSNNNDGTYDISSSGGTPNGALIAFFAIAGGNFPVGQCPGDGLSIMLGGPTVLAFSAFDGAGEVNATQAVTAGLGTVHMQVVDIAACKITNTVVATF
ncbi:MAG: hypothetical protein ACI9EF_002123 [Pseudohongiellaceae bacterium]|jgi:hypothetical protein